MIITQDQLSLKSFFWVYTFTDFGFPEMVCNIEGSPLDAT
jgi:hypothetical protein